MRNPPKEVVEAVRAMYPVGTVIEAVSIEDEYTPIPPGTQGVVTHVDDIATVFARWSNGSGLGAAYGVDKIRRMESDEDDNDCDD